MATPSTRKTLPKYTSPSPLPNILTFLRGQLFGTIPPVTPHQITSQSLSNLTVIITGANTGLGLEAARQLLSLGCVGRLILACRSLERGEGAKKVLVEGMSQRGPSAAAESTTNHSQIDVWGLDMASLESIQAFAERCNRDLDRIDRVVLNAGVDMASYQRVSEENGGYEMTVMVNVLGTFVLAVLMVNVLRRKMVAGGTGRISDTETVDKSGRMNPPRITIVGSAVQFFVKYQSLLDGAHSQEGILKYLSDEKRWDGQDRYYMSKGMVQMLVRQLAGKISAEEKKGKSMVVLNCVAPGYCRTGLFREAETFASRLALRVVGRDAHVGARALVVGAVGERGGMESHGGYMTEGMVKPCNPWFEMEQGQEIGRIMWEEVLEVVAKLNPAAVDAL